MDMPRKIKKQNKELNIGAIEKLLGQQTKVILGAVDVKTGRLDKKIDAVEKLLGQQTEVILNAVDEKIGALDKKIDAIDLKLSRRIDRLEEKIRMDMDKLANTLDKFLKQLTDFNLEFTIVKSRLDRLEKIVAEKLGARID